MAIYCIDGRPRNGKTYWVISNLPRWLREAEEFGFKIFSNIKLYPERLYKKKVDGIKENWNEDICGDISSPQDRENPKKLILYWRNIDEWNYMQKGRIICDEAQRYFNARNWRMLSESTEIKLQQHGKEDLDIWATVQHFTRLDVSLRIIVERFFHVEMIGGNPDNEKRIFGLPKKISIKEYFLEDMIRAEQLGFRLPDDQNKFAIEPISEEKCYIRKKIYALYDTRQMVGTSRPMPLRHMERMCPEPDCGKIETTHA